MKKIFLSIMLIFFATEINSQINPVWQVSFNDSIPESNYAVKSKIDHEDNVVILARGTNSGTGTGVDFILIKYSTNGVKLWNRRFDGTGHGSDYPSDLVIDKNNNIYVTGRSWGGATRNDYLTLKYSPTGELLWEKRLDWLVSRNDEAYAMSLDSNDNIYVTGLATGAFNGNELYDMVTVKYNSDGEQKWVKSFEGYGTSADWGYTVECDKAGGVYSSGFTRSLGNGHDIVTVKYDTVGNKIWERRLLNNGDDYIRPLMSELDYSGNLVISSYYKTDSTYIDYFTFKYDSLGNLLWSQTYDGGMDNTDWIHDLTIDKYDNIIVTGASRGIGTGYDYLTIKYNAAGEQVWLSRINDTIDNSSASNDYSESIICDANGNIFGFRLFILWTGLQYCNDLLP